MCRQNKGQYIYVYITIALFSLTLFSGFLLSSSSVSADDSATDNVSVSVPASCNITTNSGSGQTYNVSLLNGQYKNDIGKTRLNVFCNTKDTFAIYAVGYSGDTVGNNEMVAGVAGVSNIAAGTATSGDTSNWAMKVEAVDGTGASGDHVGYTPTILSPFNDFTGIPDTWARIAEVTSVNGKTNGAAIDASYAIYVAPKQAAANYTGKVRYTVVHPASVDPGAGQANLDSGNAVNKKLKSLASGTNVTNDEDADNLITAFVRSDTLPANFTPSDANTISYYYSLTPVYVWFDNSDGAMYYYTKAKNIYMDYRADFLFNRMQSLADISGLKYFITDDVWNMDKMFQDTKISDLTPIQNWNVSNVERMDSMFLETRVSDLTPLANWRVDNAKLIGGLFFQTQISDLTPIANWNVGNVTDMGSMFWDTNISDLTPLANWNVGNVNSMSYMFYSTQISDLTPIANWDVSNLKYMAGVFYGIPTLTNSSVISNWNVNKVTDFNGMFGGTTPKTNLPVFTSRPGTWDSNGTYIPN